MAQFNAIRGIDGKSASMPITSVEALPIMMTVPEVMAVLRLGRNTTYGLIRSGQIPSSRIGGQIRVAKADLMHYIGVH